MTSRDALITLAQKTTALSSEQLTMILALAPEMTEQEVAITYSQILNIRKAEMADMQAKLDVYEQAEALAKAYYAEEARNAREATEDLHRAKDSHAADEALNSL